ncbi:MAG TPA: proteasome subunit alpha [Acidimicrobiia bacterium]|nr:proteasome subunit alpha [Acidimicrobiia bacterium]
MSLPFYVPPEQLMKDRAEFARKGISRGKSMVAITYDAGILLLGENASRTLQKISEVYDRIAFAAVGKQNEFEQLRVGGIRRADITGYAYSRADVTARSLATAYAQTLGHIFTQEVKPYEVELMVVEVGQEQGSDTIFRITYDGTLYDDREFTAIGGSAEPLTAHIGRTYAPGMTLAAAIALAKEACLAVADDDETPGWEAAILDRAARRRAFRRLAAAELE